LKQLVLIIFIGTFSFATTLPKGWPWRGVDIMAYTVESDPTALEFIINNNIKYVRIHLFKKKVMQEYNISAKKALSLNLQWAKKINNQLSLHGIQSFITIADFPISPKECNDKRNISYWKDNSCINQIYTDVNKTVSFFKNSSILGYEFLGEPVVVKNKKALQPKDWNIIFQNIITLTRKIDKTKWLFYSPGPWGLPEAYAKVKPFKDDKIIYNAHMYTPHRYTHQQIGSYSNSYIYPSYISLKKWNKKALEKNLFPLIAFQKKYNKPISISEFSAALWAEGSEQYLEDLITIFNQNQWSWMYFNIGSKYKGWDARFDAKLDKSQKKIYTYMGEKSKRFNMLKKYLIENRKENNATSNNRK